MAIDAIIFALDRYGGRLLKAQTAFSEVKRWQHDRNLLLRITLGMCTQSCLLACVQFALTKEQLSTQFVTQSCPGGHHYRDLLHG